MHSPSVNCAFAAMAALLVTAGCTVLQSSSTTPSPTETSVGNYYYLPKTHMRVQIVEKKSSPTADPNAADITSALNQGKTSPAVPPPAAQPTVGKHVLYFTLIDRADPTHVYFLQYDGSILADDKVDFTVDENGLLNGVNATVADKTGEVLKKVGDLGKELAKLALTAAQTGPAPATETVVFEATFEIANGPVVGPIGGRLNSYGWHIEFAPVPSALGSGPGGCSKGICFRPKAPVVLNIYQQAGAKVVQPAEQGKPMVPQLSGNWDLDYSDTIMIPNFAPVFAVDMRRAALIEKKVNLTVSKGYLTKIDVAKPSEALAFIEIPIKLAQDVASIPAAAFGLQKTNAQAELDAQKVQTEMIKAEKERAAAQKELLEARKALLDYEKAQEE